MKGIAEAAHWRTCGTALWMYKLQFPAWSGWGGSLRIKKPPRWTQDSKICFLSPVMFHEHHLWGPSPHYLVWCPHLRLRCNSSRSKHSNHFPHALRKGTQARQATWGDVPSGAVLAALPLQLNLADHVALLQRPHLQGGGQSATVNLCVFILKTWQTLTFGDAEDSRGAPTRHVHSPATLLATSH